MFHCIGTTIVHLTKPKKRILLLIFIIAGVMFATSPYIRIIRSKLTSFFLTPEKILPFEWTEPEVKQILEHQIAKLSWDIINLQEELQHLKRLRMTHSIQKIPVVVSAYIIFKQSTSTFKRTFWINKGKLDGITSGATVLSGNTLVGRVIEVTERYSQCVHISDPSMKIKVYIANNWEDFERQGNDEDENNEDEEAKNAPTTYTKGMCVGKNGFCELRHVEKGHEKWREGRLSIITSNESSEFPPNLVVGTIESPYKKDAKKNQDDAGVFWDLKVDILDLKKLRTVLVVLPE